jgi:hypothetical protein
MEHYAILSVDCYADALPSEVNQFEPKVGSWTQTEDDGDYEYGYLADEFGDDRFREGQHRKWVAVLSDEERAALYAQFLLDDETEDPTLGMLTEYGHLPAVCLRPDPMDWNAGGVTPVIDFCLYITPVEEAAPCPA